MKKELCAAGLLIALIVGSIVNIAYLRGFIGDIGDKIVMSRTAMMRGDFENSELILRGAITQWTEADGYTHIFIRHSEIDSATDAFYELLSDILSQDTGSAEGAFEKLESHLISIVGMEKLTLGSIF